MQRGQPLHALLGLLVKHRPVERVGGHVAHGAQQPHLCRGRRQRGADAQRAQGLVLRHQRHAHPKTLIRVSLALRRLQDAPGWLAAGNYLLGQARCLRACRRRLGRVIEQQVVVGRRPVQRVADCRFSAARLAQHQRRARPTGQLARLFHDRWHQRRPRGRCAQRGRERRYGFQLALALALFGDVVDDAIDQRTAAALHWAGVDFDVADAAVGHAVTGADRAARVREGSQQVGPDRGVLIAAQAPQRQAAQLVQPVTIEFGRGRVRVHHAAGSGIQQHLHDVVGAKNIPLAIGRAVGGRAVRARRLLQHAFHRQRQPVHLVRPNDVCGAGSQRLARGGRVSVGGRQHDRRVQRLGQVRRMISQRVSASACTNSVRLAASATRSSNPPARKIASKPGARLLSAATTTDNGLDIVWLY